MFKKQEGAKIKLILAGGVLAVILVIVSAVIIASIEKANLVKANPELGRAMNYEEFTDKDEEVEGTENVKFSAFFLRDINQDGYAEKIKGTCKEIGKEDTLYMEINVETAGMLKNAKIEIQGNNFYLQTSLPKDNELKDNYIGNNIKVIEFNDLNNGTQKLLTGIVRSGDYSYTSSKADAIGNNINNLSRQDNKVILTGTYVNEENEEIEIRKEVNLETDWYGETRASISTTNQSKNLEDVIDEEKGVVKLDFTVYTNETANELILSKNYVEGEIPELNGYAPTSVEYTGSTGNFNYNAETRTFTIDRIAEVDEQGNVTTRLSRSNSYGIKVVYPIEAYQTLGTETIQIKIPVKTYYEGYNNPNEEFTNPYKSNTASSTIVVNCENPKGTVSKFDVTVGKRVYNPTTRYMVSKIKPLNIYNGVSDEEKDDTYTVLWQAYIGTGENLPGLVMKETATGNAQVTDQFIKTNAEEESTDDVVSNVGIYFTGTDNILGEDGWIKVYNEETGDLLVTFTKYDWNKYSSSNPYKYELPVKHIRVETSGIVKDESYLYVYNIKEIDDNKITEKYERAQFDELQYIKSTLVGYVGETYVNTDTHQANYEAPISVANLRISKNTISTQATEKNEIISIEAEGNTNYNEVEWKNGIFLVKLPEEIIDAQINNVEINNSSVNIESYELIEQNNCKYIKVVTKNDSPATYEITIDVDLSPDPRKATSTRNIELYASNEGGENYYYKAQDIYDVNNNLNTEEQVNYRTTSISMVSPNSLLTNQVASDYDDKGSEVISPQIADIKPIYAIVDQEQEVQTVRIGVQLKNNYASTTSEIQILGKIPFEGNTYVINGADLGSTFTSKMTNGGIELPEELKESATVYYSENENPDRDLSKSENGWKTAGEVTNWDNVKTYLIDLGNYVMPTGKEFVFNYVVEIPNGLAFNEVAYSHHAIYFCLDTDEGKYRTETEPNKLGLRIAEKYNLELTKYQKGKDKLVAGATYRITDEETGESKTGVTNTEGKLAISNLYAEKAYIIQEIKTPDDYELNSNIIRFIGHVDEEGNLSIERTEGFIKGDMTVTKVDGEEYKVNVEVEDEVKASIKITKKEEGTDTLIRGVRFKLTGYGLSENGKSVTTNANGEATLRGLSVEQEYALEEVKAEGYYLASPIKFKIVNNDGNYSIEVLEGGNIEQNTIEDNGIPTINVTLENDKIPTYDLELTKIKRTTPVEEGENSEGTEETTYLEGAKFRLYKGTEEIGEYVTDNTGKLTITGLYQYQTDKNIDQTYTLKEVLAPDGYAKVKDIRFKVEVVDGTLVLKEINENDEETDSTRYTVEGNIIKLIVEDSPSFKLIKRDEETGEVLPNTKFAIYNVDEGEVEARNSKGEIIGTKEIINGKEYYTVTTDARGELTLDLPEGMYKAVEVQASDEKYDISDQTYYFGIGGSREGITRQKIKWATNIGGTGYDYITTVNELDDGGYIAGGYFRSSSITIGDYTIKNNGSTSYNDGLIVKYNNNNEVEWAKSIGGNSSDEIVAVTETYDNGIVVCGNFESKKINLGNENAIDNSGYNYNGIIIKYDSKGNLLWTKRLNENSNENMIKSITETDNGELILTGYVKNNIEINDNLTLEAQGEKDGLIAKLDENGNIIWAKLVGGTEDEELLSITVVNDNKIIAGGYFSNQIVINGNNIVSQGKTDGLILEFDSKGEIIWKDIIGGSGEDRVLSLSKDLNDGYIVGGYFSDSINLNNGLKIDSNGNKDALLIKYKQNNEIEWERNFGGNQSEVINSVSVMSDGGYIAVGEFSAGIIYPGSGITIPNKGSYDGIIIKYNNKGKVEWAKGIGGNQSENVNSIIEQIDGSIIVGGIFKSKHIDLGNNMNLENINGDEKGFLLRIKTYRTVPEIQELTVENSRKEFKITTDVKEIDGRKGGIISGEDKNPYETVKYGDSSTKEIIMTPDENYEIIGITVNGEEWQFEENIDGTYTMLQFTNMIEDKHVEVTYALKDNKLIINKVDSKTQEPLQGATFKLDQIEERTEPENVIGKIVANGGIYAEVDIEEGEVTGVIGELTNNGTYYFVQNVDGTLVPTNSKTYQTANGGTTGIQSTTANSYIPIDLSGLEGDYVVVINAQISSEGPDYGYGTINQSTSAPSYSTSTGRFMYISGTSSSVTTAKDYTSNVLTGGNTYYLHLGYRKDGSIDTGDDQVVINSIKVYKANSATYNFIDNGQGGYESNNKGVDNTTANSYIPIDLSSCTGKYNLTVNAQVSSQSSDYGYATVTNSTDAPSYSSSTGRFIYISGEQEAQDYTTVLQGGQMYYLHLGYYKNSSTSSGDDKFTVNSVEITLNDSELYHTEVTTNSEGQGVVQLPFGKYQITEIEAPEGYQLLETPIEIEFRADGNHEVTISNMEKAKVLVHHYLKTAEGEYTTTKVADDELLEGKIDETYATSPHLDLEKYQLEEDAEGNLVLPENATGTYKSGIQEVTYYYEEKDIPLIVHHYIEGTENPVLLENGEQAKDEKYEGKENEEYTTNAISQEELNDKYELVEVPSNATGVYTPTETVITYYYRVKDSAGVIVHHIDTETKEKIAPDVIIPAEGTGKYGDSYTTEVSEEIPANYEYVARTDNWEGTMIDKLTEVTYEYKKVDSNIANQTIEKNGTDKIETYNEELKYSIKYSVNIENYIGKAQVTIVDALPYKIDLNKSSLDGGTYDEQTNTITWVEVVEGIDTYTKEESGTVIISKDISVVYTNIDIKQNNIENKVSGKIKLFDPEKISEEVKDTAITTTGFTVNIPVSKVWEDDSDKLGKRPTRVVFKLTGSDGSEYTKELAKPGTQGSTTTQDSTNPNKWNDIFENLPKYDVNKQEIVYTLTEINGDLTYYDASLDSTGRVVTNTSKYGKVTVHYYIMNQDGSLTTTRVPDAQGQDVQDAVIEGKEGDPYTTEEATNVSEKYELVEEKLPENAEGTIEKYNEERPQEVIYYYRLKPAKVLINYLEKDGDSDDSNNIILGEQEQIDGYVDDQYNTDTEHRKETITNNGKTYTLVENSKNTEGTMTVEDINVTYYYLQNTKATVRYVERDPETHEIVKDLEEPYTEEGLVGDEFVTYSKKFDGYKLVESPEQTTINMTKEEQTLIYYYEPVYTGLIENHIDDKTGKILYTETHDISVGESYNIPSKEFEGYDLVKSKLPENSIGIMEEEELVIVNYYYIKKAVLEVNYIDRETGEPLAEQIIDDTKHEGDSYTTEEKNFNEYDMVQLEGNKEGTMVVETDEEGNITNNRTVVTYYYAKKSAGVEEHHIDIRTGEELEEPTLHEGHVGDEYNIPSKNFLSYVVATTDKDGNNVLPENSTGKMKEEKQVVTYYYYQPAKVIVHYVEKATGKELEETNLETGELQKALVIIEGQKDDDYIATAKEFEYYTLIEKPQEGQGKMKVEITKDKEGNDVVNNTIELYYYYEAKPFNIGVEKEITGIIVNGERRAPTNGKLEKVEIYRKSTENTSVQIEYKIKVSNTGEVNGNATIEENIPEGMKLANNDGTWEEQEGKLIKVIPELGAGETKEYTVLLNWEQTGENMGEKANEVKLVETGNVPGFVDNNDKDNTSNANVIISVETGELPIGLILALVALVGLETITLRYAVVLTKKQKRK